MMGADSDDFILREEVDAVFALRFIGAEERALNAANRNVWLRSANADVYADHADIGFTAERFRIMHILGEDTSAVAKF